MQYFPHRGLRYVAYASGGAALILFIGPFLLYQSKIYTKLNLTSHLLYYIANVLIEKTIMAFLISAGVMLVITIACIIMIAKMKADL